MKNVDRRTLLQAGMALTVPVGSMSLLNLQDGESDESDAKAKKQDKKEKGLQIHYLEIVTPEVDALCKQYSAIHGIKFSKPIPGFGNARTAKLHDGGMIGIRGPLRPDEEPVVRPYALVKDLEKAVAAAKKAGAEIAIAGMPIPGGHGTIGIVIQGGIECGLWQK